MPTDQPAIQLIADVVVEHPDGRVLLAQYHHGERDDDTPRWWIPAGELEPYEHPDAVARAALDELGVTIDTIALAQVRSFRGRRGWHVMFDYRARGSGEPTGSVVAAWHDPSDLPPTAHGSWERETIEAVLSS